MENIYVDAKLVNQKVKFIAVPRSHPDLSAVLDYVSPLGDGQGFAGLELLLASFCGCVSTAVVALLRRAGKNIILYECSAEGIRREKLLSLKKIIFKIRVQSDNTEASDIEKILGVAAQCQQIKNYMGDFM